METTIEAEAETTDATGEPIREIDEIDEIDVWENEGGIAR